MCDHPPILVAASLMLALAGQAATSLCRFETEAELAQWRWAAQGQSQMERVTELATDGQFALKFTSPAWKPGQPEWPAFECRPTVADWTPYDRLVVDITNPAEVRPFLALFISDSRVPFREGLRHTFELPACGFTRFEIPLVGLPENVDRADIARLHFFTQRPETNLTLYVDNLMLLKPGESLPEPGPDFVQQAITLKRPQVHAAQRTLARLRASGISPGVDAPFAALERRVRAMRAELTEPSVPLARLHSMTEELSALPQTAERWLSIARFQNASRQLGGPADDWVVGVATSMEKLLPRNVPVDVRPARTVELSLARNEKESFQVAVLPVTAPLRHVRLSIGDLKSDAGTVLDRRHIQCDVVGYVETKARPPYAVSHVGWWPDPLLDFLGPVDVAVGDLQTFWVRVRAPKDQAPGLYRGTLTVAAEGVAARPFELAVRVRAFALPDHSPLPVAITFGPHDHPTEATRSAQADWRQSADYPINAWQRHKLRWADFLADYYINYDSLYRHGPPDWDVVRHLRARGQLVAFNLGIFDAVSRTPAAASNALAGLRVAYDQARALGVLDQAYIYGFDECQPERFPLLETTAQTLRREFPKALLMTTSYDHSYGLDTVVKTMDAWCPLTPSFKPEQAAKARAAGKQVWWYICCGPHHPHANMFIEYPAIEGRLLMGAMTARQRPDGFLYYQISIWNSRRPITSGPFTDWDPRSWTSYHGDGAWTCVGPDGVPLPTIRLENFRDGLEDYAYAVILEAIIRRRAAQIEALTASQKKWLAEAQAALPVPPALVKSMTEYSREPATLYAWRHRLADLIDESGLAEINPWGTNFGVRGFNQAPAQ